MTRQRSLLYLLLAVFFASGAAKLLGLPFEIAAFNRWGYPHELMYVIGALEVAGTLGLLLAITRRAASWGLSALMLGACATHIAHAEYGMLVVALALLVSLFAVQQPIPLLANKKAGQSL